MPKLSGWFAVIALLLGTACEGDSSRSEAGPMRTSTTEMHTWGEPAQPGTLAYVQDGDVWLHDPFGGTTRQVTNDGVVHVESAPRFIGRDRLSFLSEHDESQILTIIDLSTGSTTTVAEGRIATYAWDPGGERLAMIKGVGGDEVALSVRQAPHEPDSVLRRFPTGAERGPFLALEEYQLSWSPDGSSILYVDTYLSDLSLDNPEPTLFVMNPEGHDIISPVPSGTFARWTPDGRRLYFFAYRQQVFDPSTGEVAELGFGFGVHPSVSPDGTHVAYNDSAASPSLVVRNLKDQTERVVARDAVRAVWLSNEALAVTDTRPCPESPEICNAGGHGSLWEATGTVSKLTPDTGERTPLPLPSTSHVDVAR